GMVDQHRRFPYEQLARDLRARGYDWATGGRRTALRGQSLTDLARAAGYAWPKGSGQFVIREILTGKRQPRGRWLRSILAAAEIPLTGTGYEGWLHVEVICPDCSRVRQRRPRPNERRERGPDGRWVVRCGDCAQRAAGAHPASRSNLTKDKDSFLVRQVRDALRAKGMSDHEAVARAGRIVRDPKQRAQAERARPTWMLQRFAA